MKKQDNNPKTNEIRPDGIAIYVRWSTDEQTGNTTLEVQLEGCKHYIISQGWQVNEELIFIDDGYSGGNLNRPGMKKLRKAIENGKVDCVVVFKLDRLSRSVRDTVNLVLDEWDGTTYLKSAREPVDTTTPMGKQFFYMLVSYAEWERSVIRERTYSGKIKRAKDGQNPGIRSPYGYKNGPKEGAAKGSFEIVEHEAKMVRYIFEQYASGVGIISIVTDLNKQGIKNRSGGAWAFSTIAGLLKNEMYIGKSNFGKRTYNPKRATKGSSEPYWIYNQNYISVASDKIPPIISEELFERVKNLRLSKTVSLSGVSGRSSNNEHLLTSMLRCKKCGHGMGGKITQNRKAKYYVCLGKHHKGKDFCQCLFVNQNELDEFVETEIKEMFLTDKGKQKILSIIQNKYLKGVAHLETMINSTEDNLKSVESQIARITNDYIQGKIDAETYNPLKRDLTRNKNQYAETLIDQREELEKLKTKVIDEKNVEEMSSSLAQWDTISKYEKKLILRQWIHSIRVYQAPGSDLDVEIVYQWDVPLEESGPQQTQLVNGILRQRSAG
jgi:site-specific DNA recombinase